METVKDVATRLGVSRETIRIWTKEFARFLSPTANPSKGQQRNFADDDLPIFALIAEMKAEGRTFEDIHVALESGQRGAVPLLNPLESAGQGKQSMSALQRDLSMITAQRDEYQARMLKAEGAANELRTQVETLQDEVSRLNREIGRLEARLEDDD